MDLTIRLSEKIVHRDAQGLYQTKEIGFEATDRDVPQDKISQRTVALRLQVKKFIINTKVKEGLISLEQGIDELKNFQESQDGK